MSGQKIYLICGFHVNFYHSWRGDRNDRTGFGIDSKIVQSVLRILDEANEKGKQARGTWDCDNFWSLEKIMPRFAPEVLDAIVRRVRSGVDEAILGNWNNGDLGATTVEEFREGLRRTISNPQGSGVKDLFGAYSPIVRTQETMFTQGSIELYREQGVEAIALYYSAVPFDSIRNFVPKLTPAQMYNPLWLKSTESDSDMLMIPMYNQGDIVAKQSMRRWVEQVRKQQLSGEIPGNALIYINMDADGEIWTGIPLPKIFNRLPNVRGLPEFIDLVDEFEFLEFGTLGEYIKNNPPVGEVTVRQDLADGSYTGFSSWAEKEVNQRLWRLSERARWKERAADFISGAEGFDPATRAGIESLLYGAQDSCFENKLRLVSTTHFGMNSPAVHEERLQVGFHLARNSLELSAKALSSALDKWTPPAAAAEQQISLFSFSAINQPKYRGAGQVASGLRTILRVPFELAASVCKPEKLSLKNGAGEPVPFDLLDYKCDAQGRVESGTLYVLHTAGGASENYCLIENQEPAPFGGVAASEKELGNDLIRIKFDSLGRIESLATAGEEYADKQLVTLGATYKIDRHRKKFTPRVYHIESFGAGPLGNIGRVTQRAKIVIYLKGKNYTVEAEYSFLVFAGLPYVFFDGGVTFPLTPSESPDISVSSRMAQSFDMNWFEVMPAELRPAVNNLPGKFVRIWKHNYQNATNYYEYDYGCHDPRNKDADS
ncbi:MAG: hypothetical protein WCX65_14740, partial [bacterium]